MKLIWTDKIDLKAEGVLNIKEIAGVYRLGYYDPKLNEYHVYYIGQASNLKDRLSCHIPENEENSCCKKYLNNYKCYFKAAAVSTQSDRDACERALYDHFKPPCVEKVPDVEPAEINYD
jgi:excinuclease UvrABC nuclease subunit